MTADTGRFPAKMGSLRIYAGNFVTRSSSLESDAIDIVLKFARRNVRGLKGGRVTTSATLPGPSFNPRSQRAVFRQVMSEDSSPGSYWCQKFACCCQSWLPGALVKPADVCCQWWPNPSDVESGETVVDLSPVVELPNACSHQWWPPRAESGETVVDVLSVDELPNICCHQW